MTGGSLNQLEKVLSEECRSMFLSAKGTKMENKVLLRGTLTCSVLEHTLVYKASEMWDAPFTPATLIEGQLLATAGWGISGPFKGGLLQPCHWGAAEL